MGDVKDKVKGFMKRFNNTLSSSSSTNFKGQGRVLGSSSSGSTSSMPTRPSENPISKPKLVSPPSNSSANSKPPVANSIATGQNRSDPSNTSNPDRIPADGFDPFDSFITSGKRSGNGYSLNVFECPICGRSYRSEEEVSVHVDSCVNDSTAKGAEDPPTSDAEPRSELEACIGTFLSGKPTQGSLDIVLKLLRNIVREPENSKFRKIRLSNPKIKEAIGEAVGGVELLEFVGFKLQEEDGEMWATMEVPTEEQINLLCKVIDLIDQPKLEEQQKKASTAPDLIEPKKVDRQIRVFFAVPENIAAKIELPDSFYRLSVEERNKERTSPQHYQPNPTEPMNLNVPSTGLTTCVDSIDCANSIVLSRGDSNVSASSCANLLLRLRAISVSVAAAFAVAVAATAVAAAAIRVVKMKDSAKCERVQSNSKQKQLWKLNPVGSSLTSITIISYRLRLPESVQYIRAACWSTILSLFFIGAAGNKMIYGIAAAPLTRQMDH